MFASTRGNKHVAINEGEMKDGCNFLQMQLGNLVLSQDGDSHFLGIPKCWFVVALV